MSPLYLYALVGEPPARPLPRGMAGERLRLVDCDGVLAAVGEMGEAPPLDPDALRSHDAAVRALSGDAGLLPARFGSVLRDEDELRAALRPRAAALRAALERVRGCEQMTLRMAWSGQESGSNERTEPEPDTDTDTDTETGHGPGTRYLARRRAEQESARAIPEVARLLDAVAALVRDERLESHRRPPLIASAYHLVARGSLEAYRARVEAAAAREVDLHVTLSGPWPPYAFAPGELG
ncbi:MAG: hypothetical protein DMF78_01125 [Acidobacteria bacterium]|nr:MAG: hypothetical protein DMF78_01125 [Acidobacteriota bacterium]